MEDNRKPIAHKKEIGNDNNLQDNEPIFFVVVCSSDFCCYKYCGLLVILAHIINMIH